MTASGNANADYQLLTFFYSFLPRQLYLLFEHASLRRTRNCSIKTTHKKFMTIFFQAKIFLLSQTMKDYFCQNHLIFCHIFSNAPLLYSYVSHILVHQIFFHSHNDAFYFDNELDGCILRIPYWNNARNEAD